MEQRKVRCAAHLAELGRYLYIWTLKFTSDAGSYPLHGWPEYHISGGRDGLNALRTFPTRQTSLCPQNDDLFICPVRGTGPSPNALDYRVPSPAFPGGHVCAATPGNWPILCDRVTNHSSSGDDDMNVLLYSGAVIRASQGSPEWNTAMQYTQDP